MNKPLLLLFTGVLITSFLSCKKADSPKKYPYLIEKTDSTKVIQFENNQAVVFTNDFIANVSGYKNTRYFNFSELYIPDSTELFEPTIYELISFEARLESYIQSLKKESELLTWDNPTDLEQITLWNSQAQSVDSIGQLKQYWGYVDKNLDSLLIGTYWSNSKDYGFRDLNSIIKDWKSSPIIINDGGPDYYRAKYNLSTDTLVYIMVNGF